MKVIKAEVLKSINKYKFRASKLQKELRATRELIDTLECELEELEEIERVFNAADNHEQKEFLKQIKEIE